MAGYVQRSRKDLQGIGITDYLIAKLIDGHAIVISRWALVYSTSKPVLSLSGKKFANYDTALQAIKDEVASSGRHQYLPKSAVEQTSQNDDSEVSLI